MRADREPSVFEDVHRNLEQWQMSSGTVCVLVMHVDPRLLSHSLCSVSACEDGCGSQWWTPEELTCVWWSAVGLGGWVVGRGEHQVVSEMNPTIRWDSVVFEVNYILGNIQR